MKINQSKYKPGDRVFIMVPNSTDLLEATIMFENPGGYTAVPLRKLSSYGDYYWNDKATGSFYNVLKGSIIDVSEDLLVPYGLGAEVLFRGKNGRIL